MARAPKPDQACVDAVDLAREYAVEQAGPLGVGEHLGCQIEGDRVVTHLFACDHPGYRGWHWSVTVVRASRAKTVTVNEAALLPGEEALLPPNWVPWTERLADGDLEPGVLQPTPDNDPRLEPGYTGGEDAADADPAEASQIRAVVAELGLGRERVLSPEGRDEAIVRWRRGPGGPNNEMTDDAPAPCETCGYFIRLSGSLGAVAGVCANRYSPQDGSVVTVDHGCGGHSDVVAEHREAEHSEPIWDTVSIDATLFD